MYLTVSNATKRYGAFVALDDVSVSLKKGEFVSLLGPSGCGKTTLLRIIAGLTDIDEGDVRIEDVAMSDMPARKRGFGIVFQSYSLFPNMSVAENIAYGLKVRKTPSDQVRARVKELLEIIKLPDIIDKYPGQLSGGQQQRVALARAIAVDPKVLLLDEPLSALDANVRASLRHEIRQLQRELKIPTLMVTHDQEEAMAMSDRIICMNHGVVVQVGTPEELYHKPATRFVADFMGSSNLITTKLIRETLPHLMSTRPEGADEAYDACIRPEEISLVEDESGVVTVMSTSFLGNLNRIDLDGPFGHLLVETHGPCSFKRGQKVSVDVKPEACIWVLNDEIEAVA